MNTMEATVVGTGAIEFFDLSEAEVRGALQQQWWTVGVQWEYSGCTVGVQWVYSRCTVGVQWVYILTTPFSLHCTHYTVLTTLYQLTCTVPTIYTILTIHTILTILTILCSAGREVVFRGLE
jgi:hypothetical protein